MITLVGVGHVFRIAGEIQEFILSSDPDVVAVELDRNKLANLLGRKLAREVYTQEKTRAESGEPGVVPDEADGDESRSSKDEGKKAEEPEESNVPATNNTIEVRVNINDAGQVYRTESENTEETLWQSHSLSKEERNEGIAPPFNAAPFDYHRIMNENGDVRLTILNPRTGTTEGFYLRKSDITTLFLDKKKKGVPLKYRLVESIQNRLASENEVVAGDEMLAAVESAWLLGMKLSLIDMDTQKLLQRIHQQMSLLENLRFYMSIFAGMLKSKGDVTEELFKYQADYTDYMEDFARKFPVLKRELIDNRNNYMAQNILNLAQHHDHVLAVVGEGHVEGIRRLLLTKLQPEELVLKRLFDFEEFKKMKEKQKN